MFEKEDYRNKYVAFVDILGFKQLVQAADRDPDLRQFISVVVEKLRRTCGENPYHGGCVTQFSDCIVMSYDATEVGLSSLMSGCTILTTNLIQHGILLRGGISVGNLRHDREILFGVGLINAYAFDCPGQPPKIAIDPLVLAELPADSRCRQLITADEDGSSMLHSLIDFEYYDPSNPKPGMVCWDEPSTIIAGWISAQVADSSLPNSINTKYQWLKRYWNRSVRIRGVLPCA